MLICLNDRYSYQVACNQDLLSTELKQENNKKMENLEIASSTIPRNPQEGHKPNGIISGITKRFEDLNTAGDSNVYINSTIPSGTPSQDTKQNVNVKSTVPDEVPNYNVTPATQTNPAKQSNIKSTIPENNKDLNSGTMSYKSTIPSSAVNSTNTALPTVSVLSPVPDPSPAQAPDPAPAPPPAPVTVNSGSVSVSVPASVTVSKTSTSFSPGRIIGPVQVAQNEDGTNLPTCPSNKVDAEQEDEEEVFDGKGVIETAPRTPPPSSRQPQPTQSSMKTKGKPRIKKVSIIF